MALILLSTFGCDSDDTTHEVRDPVPHEPLSWLKAKQGPEAGIYDSLERQMLLRGVNFNHLGDYFQTDPSLPTVAALGPDDWDDAGALGTNVIRLVTTWSAWEPERDRISEAYLARVRDAVAQANAHGMYVVIDMHQDAWSKFVFTPVEETCPDGTRHQKGWDGAPEWATFTDGWATCTPGSREDSPAVRRAWDAFYANRDGIRDQLADLWGYIASQFADEPGVAGYDLLNEPGNGSNIVSTSVGLTEFYRSAIRAIRDAEAQAQSQGHIIFFEPSVYGRAAQLL
jgi:endoglycosylceramidase